MYNSQKCFTSIVYVVCRIETTKKVQENLSRIKQRKLLNVDLSYMFKSKTCIRLEKIYFFNTANTRILITAVSLEDIICKNVLIATSKLNFGCSPSKRTIPTQAQCVT